MSYEGWRGLVRMCGDFVGMGSYFRQWDDEIEGF